MAKHGSSQGGKGQPQGRPAQTNSVKLPASCRCRKSRSKRLSATVDDGAEPWKIHSTACTALRMGPWPPVYSRRFCFRSFHSPIVLGTHMNLHRTNQMATEARDKEVVGGAAARELQVCNETATVTATITPKIQVRPEFAAGGALEILRSAAVSIEDPGMAAFMRLLEILRSVAVSNQDPSMAGLLRLLGRTPEVGSITGLPVPPLLNLSLAELGSISELRKPPGLSLPLSQTKSSPVVMDCPPSSRTTNELSSSQLLELLLCERRSSQAMPTTPESIASSSKRAFHPYENGLVKMGRFSVMASAPVDLELCLGRNPNPRL